MQNVDMTWRNQIYVFALAAVIGSAKHATADDAVVLINGDRITGQIESVTEDSILLRSQHLGDVLIPRKSVASFGAQDKVLSETVATTNKTITATTEKLWRSSVEFGFNMSQAEHNTRTLALQLETKREKKPSLLHLQALAFWGDNDGTTTTQKAEGRAKYEYDWVRRWYWYNQFSTAYDHFRGLDLELQEGPGAGFRFLDSRRQKLALEAGPTYLMLIENDHRQRQAFSLRMAQTYSHKINQMVSLNETLEFIQRTDIFAARQFRAEMSLMVALTRMLRWRMTLLDEYITHPVRNTPENSLQLIGSLGVMF